LGEKVGLSAAIRDAMAGGTAPAVAAAERQLPLIATVEHDEPEREQKGVGRPAGSRNKRTQEWTEYLLSRFRSPLLVLAETYSRPVADLAAELGVTRAEAFALQLAAAKELAPYLHQRQPLAVNLDGKGVMALTLWATPALEGAAEVGEGLVIDATEIPMKSEG
jgi:hypothetical protein